jgi:4-hydroxyphenylacetate 3-monooxygenase
MRDFPTQPEEARGEDMPIRRGEEYLESLRDGRRLWLMGQRVEDVTTHPALAGCARSVAAVYDLQHDPAHQDLLTMPSPTTGQHVSLAYLLPRSVDELARQRRMYEFLVRRTGGVAARLPQHLATVVLGLYDVRGLLGHEDLTVVVADQALQAGMHHDGSNPGPRPRSR